MPVRLSSHRLPFSLSIGGAAPPIPPAPPITGGGGGAWRPFPHRARLRLPLPNRSLVRQPRAMIAVAAGTLGIGSRTHARMTMAVAAHAPLAVATATRARTTQRTRAHSAAWLQARTTARLHGSDPADELFLLGLDEEDE